MPKRNKKDVYKALDAPLQASESWSIRGNWEKREHKET